MGIIQIVVICLCATIFIVVLDKHKEFGLYLSLVVGVIVFFLIVDQLKIIMEVVERISNLIQVDDLYIKVLFQILGIAFISEFGAQLCKDAGQGAIASNIELAGKVIILVVSMPVILAIIDLVENIV